MERSVVKDTGMKCLVCGSGEYKKTVYGGYIYLDKEYDIVRCRDCGFMFVDPVPEEDVLEDIYKSDEYFNNYYIPGAKTTNYLEGMDYIDKRTVGNIKTLKGFKAKGRLLDAGCAGGRFLKAAKDAGYECAGVETNPAMASFVEGKLLIPVENKKLEDADFPEGEFDIIHLGDVIEHLTDPEADFIRFKKWLKNDGVLFIEQPLMYNRSVFNFFLKLNMILSGKRHSHNPPLHIWEFTPATLRRFLTKTEFRILHEEIFENRAKDLSVYKRPKPGNYISHFLKDASSLISGLPFLRRLKLGDRAVIVCEKKRPRILFVHPNLDIGGAEMNRFSALKSINRDKYDITVCCLSHKGKLAGEIERSGFPVHCLGTSDRAFNMLTTFRLYRFIKKGGFDIVHTCLSNTNLHGRVAAKMAKVQVIISEEQSDYERYDPRLGALFRLINRFLAGFTDKIICCSENVRYSLAKAEKISPERMVCIHNCTDTLNLPPKRTRDDMRGELGLDSDAPVIGYVASLAERKGHDLLLSALENLKRIYPEIALLLVGKGPLRSDLGDLASRKGLSRNVMFLGERRDVPDILSAMDVFVSPARREAFGINIIEAMYIGLPCVATRVGGVPEVIDDGINGMLVPPGNAEELAGAIDTLLNDREKAASLGAGAREKVLRSFTSGEYAARLENIYDNLIRVKNEEMQ